MKGDTVDQSTTHYLFIGLPVLGIAAQLPSTRGVDFTKLESLNLHDTLFVGFRLGWPSNTNEDAIRAKEQAVRRITGLEPKRYWLHITETLVEG